MKQKQNSKKRDLLSVINQIVKLFSPFSIRPQRPVFYLQKKLLTTALAVLVLTSFLYFPQSPFSDIHKAEAAVTATSLTTGGNTTCTSPQATASITPSANKLVLAWVVNTMTASNTVTPTMSGNGLTWVQVSTVTFNTIATPTHRLTLFRAMGASPTTGTASITVTGSPTGCSWSISEFGNVDTSGTNGSGAVVATNVNTNRSDSATSLTVTLPNALANSLNATAGGFSVNVNNATAITSAGSYVELGEANYNTPATDIQSQWQAAGSTTVNVTNTSGAIAGIAVEIQHAPATTIADGSNPSNVTIAPGGSETDLDAFTLQTNSGTESITSITVNLSTAVGIGTLKITDNSNVSLGSTGSPAAGANAISISSLTATTSLTTYKVRIIPLSHANMPAVPGATASVTGTVTSWVGSTIHLGTDTASATVTIDNLSPNNATSTSGSAGDTKVTLNWTTASGETTDSVVLRWAASSPGAEVPVEGSSYSAGNTITTATVACVITSQTTATALSKIDGTGGSSGCTTSALTNGQAYSYKVFEKDSNGNFDAGVTFTGSPFTPVAPSVTLATGTDPSTTIVAPSSGITDAGAFTFTSASGTDTITALTVTLAGSGTPYDGISEVRITSDNGSTTYFTAVSSFSSNTVNFSGGTSITATTTPTQYKIRITPKTHATMAAVPGASYVLSPIVASWTGSNPQLGSDTNANTLTIDNTSPNSATSTSGSADNAKVTLNWTTASGETTDSVVLRWAASSPGAEVPVEGASYTAGNTITTATVACVITSQTTGTALSKIDGTGGSSGCTTSALTNGQAYSYKVFQKDSNGNFDAGVTFTGSPFTPNATTLGNGTNPSNSTVAPGTAITDLDAFTFITATGTDSITALTVTLASGTYAGISEIRITSDDGSTLYFSAVANPSSETVNFSGGTPILVTTSSTPFKIRITPKSHSAMAAVPGASYAVTGTVIAYTSTNPQVGSDSGSATITIDNLSPNSATSTSGTAGDANNIINWTTSNSADFDTTSGSVLLRWTSGSIGAEVPVEGTTYTAGETIGTATVACVISSASSAAQSKTDGTSGSAGCNTSALTNDQAYSYKIFQKDTRGNYDAGVAITGSPFTPTLTQITTIATGTDPSDASVPPESGIIDLDKFVLSTNTGTDSVTALTVTLASGTHVGLSEVRVTSSDGSTLYFAAVTDPSSVTVNFSGGTPITVTTTPTTYKIRITPKTHGNMPVPPGATYAVTGTVTAYTSTNAQSGTDSTSATITIDNESPSNVSSESASPDDQQVELSWTNPVDADFDNVLILKKTSSISDAPSENTIYSVSDTIGTSTVLYVGTGTSLTDSGLVNDTTYFYKIFTKDDDGNYSIGTQVSATPSLTPTTIIATGTDPASATIEPGDSDEYIDQFTLRTNTGTDSVPDLIVTTTGTSSIVSIMIFSNDLGTQYFTTVTVPSGNTWSFSGGTPIPVAAIASFRIIISVKSHADLASGNYPLTARVSSYTSTNQQSGNDGAGTTITIDNTPAAIVTSASGTAGDGQVSLTWTNPVDSDFSQVVILRRTGIVSDSPVEGSTYSVGATIGSSTVACVTSSTSCIDSGRTNGVAYHYKIFTQDLRNNYSAGVVPTGSPFTPEFIETTTLANGTNPSDDTVAPESGIIDLDTFRLTTNSATDSVTALTLTLADGTYEGISEISITSDDGVTTYFSAVTNPSSNTVNFSGGTAITATTTPTEYKIRITPKSHADMPVPPGESFDVEGTVTSFTSTYVQAGSDSSSATITIDNLSPSNVSSAAGTADDGQVALSWTNPATSDFDSVVILRSTSAVADAPDEGSSPVVTGVFGASSVIYILDGTSFTDTGLVNGTAYHYKIFSRDTSGNYSIGVVPTGSPFTPAVAGAPSQSSGSGGYIPPALIVEPPPIVPEPVTPTEFTPTPPAPIPLTPTEPVAEPAGEPEVEIIDETKTDSSSTSFYDETLSNITQSLDGMIDSVNSTFVSIQNFFDTGIITLSKTAIAFEQTYTTIISSLNSRYEASIRTLVYISDKTETAAGSVLIQSKTFLFNWAWSVIDKLTELASNTQHWLTNLSVQNKVVIKDKPLAKPDTIILRSGELELVADQSQQIQAVVGFNFQADLIPSKTAESIGGTYKFTDSDGDGTWSADVKMPEVTGQFKINTEIAYADGAVNKLQSNVLIDPEGYVYEQLDRGQLRIEKAIVTLWQKAGESWEVWPANKYNQANPQTTNQTGQYSFLAPSGEYYLEVSADKYETYKSEPFKLDQANPIHAALKIQYLGQ